MRARGMILRDLGKTGGGLPLTCRTYLWQKGMHYTAAQLQDYLALLRTNDLIVLAGTPAPRDQPGEVAWPKRSAANVR